MVPTSVPIVYCSSVSLLTAPMSFMNWLVTTETALPMARRSVLRRLPASVVVAA